MREIGLLIDGEWRKTRDTIDVTNKFTNEVIAKIHVASKQDITNAVKSAKKAQKDMLTPYERYEILLKASNLINDRTDKIAKTMVKESGMPIKDALGEIKRGKQALILSAEEAKRITGEVLPITANPGMENRLAFTIQEPVGVVCAITPFNAPFSNVIHKVAPAIASGNSVVLKPSSSTPQTAVEVLSLLHDAGLSKDKIQLLFGEGKSAEALLENQEIDFYSFTGSTRVGEIVKSKTGLRRVGLELGNNSATIVCEDADLAMSVPIIARAAFRKAGQVCVSLQRVYAHRSISNKLTEMLKREIEKLKIGDPLDPETDVGPVVNKEKASELEKWVENAASQGAIIETGGKSDGSIFYPTLLSNVHHEMDIVGTEVFGPVLSIVPYDDLDEAINFVNDSQYGLQAGIFTNNINTAMRVAQQVEVGGININETSNTRFDAMPYGGVKHSGIGREGPKYAIKEMTETKVIQMNILS